MYGYYNMRDCPHYLVSLHSKYWTTVPQLTRCALLGVQPPLAQRGREPHRERGSHSRAVRWFVGCMKPATLIGRMQGSRGGWRLSPLEALYDAARIGFLRSPTSVPVQKVLSGSGRAERLRLMGKYIGLRLVARPELDNTFWTYSTVPLARISVQRT